jgi:hypothetical protein
MYESYEPDELTPDERLEAVAAILARAVLRLSTSRSEYRIFRPENCEESGDDPLEVGGETVLSVTAG